MLLQKPLIGIDIGSSAIKFIEFSGRHEKKLQRFGLEAIPQGAIVDGLIKDEAVVKQALRRLLRQAHVNTLLGRRVALALGGSSVIIKRALFPNKDDLELSDLIEAEAAQHFQHDLEDLYFTWYGTALPSAEGERSIILAGVKRDLADQYIGLVRSVGLRVGLLDCEVFSVYNMFEYSFGQLPGLIAIANIGASSTQVSLVGHGEYLYTRDIAIGGDHYTKNLANMLQLATEKAEVVKVNASSGESPQALDVENALKDIHKQLVSEIQITIDFFFQSGDAPLDLKAVSAVFLTGGGARTLGLAATIAAAFNVPVNLVNPFHRVDIPKKYSLQSLLGQGHLYGVSVGLALREWNDHL